MLKKNLLAIATLSSVAFLPLAQAADQPLDTRFYVAPFGTFVKTGGDRNASDGWGGGVGFGKMLDEHFNVEVKGFYERFSGIDGPWDLMGGTADLQYFFLRDRFSPYAVVGAGGMNTCASANCAIGLIAETGLGFTYELLDNLLFRTDVRYRYNNNLGANVKSDNNDQFHDMTVNAGFVIPFGEKPKAFVPKEIPPIAAAPVPDCSTLDSDADGINDCLDRCPGSLKGSVVDENGCLIKLVLHGINFKYDSAELTNNAMTILDNVAASLIAYPQKNDIEVQGHASSEGSDDYNMRLSQRRSASVVKYFKSKGITNRLIPKGYGESKPIADNSTEAGRSENRRIELIWLTE